METMVRLSHEEDGMLRRLHFFEMFGARLAPSMRALKQSLQARDLRSEIREPFDGRVIWSG